MDSEYSGVRNCPGLGLQLTQRTASPEAVLCPTPEKARALRPFQKINHASHSGVGANSRPSFPTV